MGKTVHAKLPLAKGPARGYETPEQACRKALKLAGLSAGQIAQKLGIAKSQAGRMLTGEARVQGRIFAVSERARAALEAICGDSRSAPAESGLRRITAELGEVSQALDLALADGELDDDERLQLERELLDVVQRSQEMLRGLRE